MNKLRTAGWFLLLVILMSLLVTLAAAQDIPTASEGRVFQSKSLPADSLVHSLVEEQIEFSDDGRHTLSLPGNTMNLAPAEVQEADAVVIRDAGETADIPAPDTSAEAEAEISGEGNRIDFTGRHVGYPQPNPQPSALDENCSQLLGNTNLTVNGTSVAPWYVLDTIVYFSDSAYVSSPHSLYMEDNDEGGADDVDAFAQTVMIPNNLTRVRIDYWTATVSANDGDYTGGALWTVDGAGDLENYIFDWFVRDTDGTWQDRYFEITDPAVLNLMEGKDVALILFNETNNSTPNEISYFDNVELTACKEDTPNSYIKVKKLTNPTGATQKFTFNPSWSGANFQLKHNETKTSPALAAGNYNVKELAQAGWSLTSATCSDGSSSDNISLQKGETVTCTFRNTKDAFIRVKKETDPNGATQKFTFNPSWSGANFQLKDGESKKSPVLTPGTYNVKELAQSGWALTSSTCSDGSSPNNISLQAGETVTCTFYNKKQATSSQTCRQVLANTALDIVEFGDGTGTAEPWSILNPIVYYIDDPAVAYSGYSLFFEDGDSGDPDPTLDSIAQGFQAPEKLTEIKIEYRRATINTNANDKVFGNLWQLDDNWILDTSKSERLVTSWEVGQQEATWVKETQTSKDAALLNKLNGRKIALILFSSTDNGGTKEFFLFDDVKVYACTKAAPTAAKLYIPTIMYKHGKSGPICTPPSENPLDQWHSNRGLVQTGAACSSTMSNVDTADYYTFKPTKSGNHTLRLTNLPGGTEWSSMIFIDQASPEYAPGGAADGLCRITQPGSVPKQVVCNLDKNKDYFVKVSSGSTPVFGNYTMKITGP